MLELSIPEGQYPMERAHAGAVFEEEFRSVGWTDNEEVHEVPSPREVTPLWTRGRAWAENPLKYLRAMVYTDYTYVQSFEWIIAKIHGLHSTIGSYLVKSSTPKHVCATNFRATLNRIDESQQILKRNKLLLERRIKTQPATTPN
ncbi:hypothetical protein AV530_006611 [Patagioenas fasciata monilis]|uniref:Uncharacterized protein n=1 Tax=Patagioenas fasciata monilis TaxID=372326 RepID=A0A1V4KH70_PATFA|nr:hypothetical protein AV530_006611 [Patagioenas fasciata monilis]